MKSITPESTIKSTNTLTDIKSLSAYSLDNRQLLFTKAGSSSDDVKLYNYDGTGVTLTFPASYSGMFLMPFAVQPNTFIGTNPTLNLDFTTGVLNSNFTFTRSGPATLVNSSGVVQYANHNLVRNSTFSSLTGWAPNGTGTTTNADGVLTLSTSASQTQLYYVQTNANLFQDNAPVSGRVYSASINITAISGGISYQELITIGGSISNVTRYKDGVLVSDSATASTGLVTIVWTSGGAPNNLRIGISASGTTSFPSASVSMTLPRCVIGSQTQPTYIESPVASTYQAPRFDYDPTTLTARGLLIEPDTTNYIKTSEDIGGVAQWGITNVTQGTPLISSPSGTVTGVLLQETAVSGAHVAYQTITVTSDNIYTFSVWVKPYASRTAAALRLATTGAAVYYSVAFDLTGNGSIGSTVSTGSPTNTGQSIKYYAATGWYRISITMTSTGSTSLIPYVCVSNSSSPTWVTGLPVYTGNTSQGIYAWGAQLEDRAVPSSYIPTGSTTVTRNKDVASMPVNTFTYSNTGTFAYYGSRIAAFKTAGYHDIFTVDGAGNLGYPARLGVENATGRVFANTTNTASSTISEAYNKGDPGAGPTMADNSKIKVAFTYDVQIPQGNLISSNSGNTYMYLTAPVSATTNLPLGLTLNLLRDALNPTWFEKLQYWPVRMESSQLQALTTTIP